MADWTYGLGFLAPCRQALTVLNETSTPFSCKNECNSGVLNFRDSIKSFNCSSNITTMYQSSLRESISMLHCVSKERGETR